MDIFEWDLGNGRKSLVKHGITNREAESAFADPKRYVFPDLKHSSIEDRYICIGKSELGNLITSIYTNRGRYTRIISTRIANNKERTLYGY